MVEIYREPELESMIANVGEVDEWKKIIDDLGMSGQQALVKPDTAPSVYIHMNEAMVNMFKVLCPASVKYREYNKSTIPLDVLREIALCKHEGYFHEIYIWYDDISPDPIVIGKINDKWNSPLHLIARFGDEVLPFSELRIKARARLLESVKAQYKSLANAIEVKVDEFLAGKEATLGVKFDGSNYSGW